MSNRRYAQAMRWPYGGALVLSFLMAISAWGGGWVSSGGDGVVCFDSLKVAAAVERRIVADGIFPKSYLPLVTKVESLERFEDAGQTRFSRALRHTSFESLRREKSEFVANLSPLLAFQFKLLESELAPSSWLASHEVREINDSVERKSIREKDPHCVLAQIFSRSSLSRSRQKPLIRMLYQIDLWSKLSVLDQALLFFHESLYTLGRELSAYGARSHANSVDVRKVSRVILGDALVEHWEDQADLRSSFSRQFDSSYDLELAVRSLKTASFRGLINHLYGDFALLFLDDVRGAVPHTFDARQISQASRFESFYGFIVGIRKIEAACQKSEKTQRLFPRSLPNRDRLLSAHCRDEAMSMPSIAAFIESLPAQRADETAFVFLGYWNYDIARHIFPAEEILVWTPGCDPSPSAEGRKSLQYLCRRLQLDPVSEDFQELRQGALRYCARLP